MLIHTRARWNDRQVELYGVIRVAILAFLSTFHHEALVHGDHDYDALQVGVHFQQGTLGVSFGTIEDVFSCLRVCVLFVYVCRCIFSSAGYMYEHDVEDSQRQRYQCSAYMCIVYSHLHTQS